MALEFGAQHGSAFMTCVDESGQLARQSSDMPCTIMKMCDTSHLSETGEVSHEFCEAFVSRLPQMFKREELEALEKKTTAQSASKVWYDHRHGRITASMFGDVLRAEAAGNDGKSVVRAVCERRFLMEVVQSH